MRSICGDDRYRWAKDAFRSSGVVVLWCCGIVMKMDVPLGVLHYFDWNWMGLRRIKQKGTFRMM